MTKRMMLAAAALAVALVAAGPALAQQVTVDLGSDASLAARSIQLITLVTLLSLAPGLAVMVTCFPFVVTVLSILRQAMGLQQSPPNMVIVSLALFLTWYVMDPVFTRAWQDGAQPLIAGQIKIDQAIPAAVTPFRGFMALRVNPQTLSLIHISEPTRRS